MRYNPFEMLTAEEILRLKCVLFDLGGTLIEYVNNPSQEIYKEFILQLDPDDPSLSYHGFCVLIDNYWIHMQDEFYSATGNPDIADYNRLFLTRQGFTVGTSSRIAKSFSDTIFNLELHGTRLKDGVSGFLEMLKEHGMTLGIVTNASHNNVRIHKLLAKVEIGYYFDDVVISSEVGIKKPDPEIFRISLNNLGMKAADSVYLGDRMEYDAVGAENAGIAFICVSGKSGMVEVAKLFRQAYSGI